MFSAVFRGGALTHFDLSDISSIMKTRSYNKKICFQLAQQTFWIILYLYALKLLECHFVSQCACLLTDSPSHCNFTLET